MNQVVLVQMALQGGNPTQWHVERHQAYAMIDDTLLRKRHVGTRHKLPACNNRRTVLRSTAAKH
jgi:hypothetical protein